MRWAEHQRMFRFLSWLALPSSGCLLYTGPINTAPTVSIIVPATFERGKAMTFTASSTDDEVSTLRHVWNVVREKCPTDGSLPKGAPLGQGLMRSFTFSTDDVGDFCVFVTVTDVHGATARAMKDFAVADGPTTVTITPGSVVTTALAADARPPLYSRLRFKIAASDPDAVDQAQLSVTRQLTAPDGRMITPPSCADAPSTDVCFVVDQPGLWTLAATVQGPAGVITTAKQEIEVAPDQAPCITEASPALKVQGLVREADDLEFAVTKVKDDGDPLPAPLDRPSTSTFAWSWRQRGGAAAFTRVLVPDVPRFSFPAGLFTSGQVVDVRVEVRDRRNRQTELLECGDADKPECEVRRGCNQWVTWTVVVL